MQTTSSPTSSEPSRASRPRAALAAWLALAALQIILVVAATVAVDEEDAGETLYDYGSAIGNGAVYLVLLGLTIGIANLHGDVRDTLGLRRFTGRWVWLALGVVTAVAVFTFAISRLFGIDPGEEQGILPEEWRPERAGAIAANGVVVVAIAPLVEELFFRGVGVRVLSVWGSVAAVLVSGVAFGLAHGLLIGLAPLALFGIGLAWVRLRSASVWPGVIAHALYNGAVLALGLACLSDAECRGTLGCGL
jgi:membrane protease YdiL (CAAX protease family)